MLKTYTVAQLASVIDGVLVADHSKNSTEIFDVASLKSAKSGTISFFLDKKYFDMLKLTQASAVILKSEDVAFCPCVAIVHENPYLAFAKIAKLFDKEPSPIVGVHSSAIIGQNVQLGESVSIGPNVVIGQSVVLGDYVAIGANTVIGDFSTIGHKTRIKENVTIYHNTHLGSACLIHANTVLGSDGFGNAKDDQGKWHKISQLGRVMIGDHVEVGASTTIDRGTLDDTIISSGVRIDNQVQIGHNVCIGENTAIAGCVGIAGSTIVGKNCLIGGLSAINGHITICDHVILAAASQCMSSIKVPGYYSGVYGVLPHMQWKRFYGRLFRLEKIEQQIKSILHKLDIKK